MRMAGTLLVLLPIIMDMAMLSQLRLEFRVARGLGLRQRDRIMRSRVANGRQQHSERHRKRDDETKG